MWLKVILLWPCIAFSTAGRAEGKANCADWPCVFLSWDLFGDLVWSGVTPEPSPSLLSCSLGKTNCNNSVCCNHCYCRDTVTYLLACIDSWLNNGPLVLHTIAVLLTNPGISIIALHQTVCGTSITALIIYWVMTSCLLTCRPWFDQKWSVKWSHIIVVFVVPSNWFRCSWWW